jgi:uncharacterized protein
MKCPICPDATLLMTDRQGVEIDYCPQCRGVWPDRGELDKFLQIAALPANPSSMVAGATQAYVSRPEIEDSDRHGGQGQQYRRKKSWMSEIFD